MYRIKWIAVLIFFLGFLGNLQATHITGAELTYKCVNASNRVYQFKLTMYRDCANGQANFDNNIRLFVFRGNNNTLYTSVNVSLTQSGIQLLPVKWDACTGAPYNLCVVLMFIIHASFRIRCASANLKPADCLWRRGSSP